MNPDKRYNLENRFRLWDLDCGECIEIGDDPDGLGLTEIVWVSDEGKRAIPINITNEGLPKLIEALQARLAWIINHPEET